MRRFLPDNIKCVAVVSPAGPPVREKLARGISILESSGIRVKTYPGTYGVANKADYLASPDVQRAEEFMQAYLDDEVDMIISSRGGYGCSRMLPYLEWNKLKQRDIPVAGYSDLTSLFFAMTANDCGTPVASNMVSELGSCSDRELEGIFAACSGKRREFSPDVIKPGRASGNIIAGNLTVAASCAGTAYMPSSKGKILLLEDIGESPYRIDRSLNQLCQCGFLTECSALIFGYFSGADNAEVRQILEHYSNFVNGPVLSGFAYGHEMPFDAVSFKQCAKIDQNRLSIQ